MEERVGKNEFYGLSPLELQEKFTQALALIIDPEKRLERIDWESDESIERSFNYLQTPYYSQLFRKVDAILKYSPTTKTYRRKLRYQLGLLAQFGRCTWGGMEDILLCTVRNPVLRNGSIQGSVIDESGGMFDPRRSSHFEARGMVWEKDLIEKESRQSGSDDIIPYFVQDFIMWRDDYISRFHYPPDLTKF